MEERINKDDILSYGYYDDAHNYVVVINRQKLKEIFNADKVIFEEIFDSRL